MAGSESWYDQFGMWILAKVDMIPTGGYARGQIIACPKCAIIFRLWTPSSRDVQTAEDILWLKGRIAETCDSERKDGHPDVLNVHEHPPGKT
jgi:uncharacterized C2H2 Zn-finger protein